MRTRKIALEEAFSAPSTEPYLEITMKVVAPEERPAFIRLLEDSDQRIAAMDAAGIDIFVLSQTSPGVQIEKDPAVAVQRAREANDYLQGQIEQHPDRYRGFAHLAMQDVQAACDELKRCVEELGFLGALINGNTNGVYLDDECYMPFWERVVELDVPVYIHPADPYMQPYVLEGYTVMQGVGVGVEHGQLLALPAPALQRALRPLPRAHDHPGAHGRDAPVLRVAHRLALQGGGRPGQAPPEEEALRLLPLEPHHHDDRRLPGFGPAVRDRGDGRGPRAVLGRLPLRGDAGVRRVDREHSV